jgi:hypothetical protein
MLCRSRLERAVQLAGYLPCISVQARLLPSNKARPAGPTRGRTRGSGTIQVSARWRSMDTQTKHEIWILAVSAAILEAPFLAIAAVAVLGH